MAWGFMPFATSFGGCGCRRFAGGAEGVIPDFGGDAGVSRAPADHAKSVLLMHGLCAELAGAAGGVAEQRPAFVCRDPGGSEVLVEKPLEPVVAGHLVLFAALLVQPHPAAAALDELILDLHFEHGPNARKAVGHRADQGAIAQPENG